jgi:hypothetical protein
MLTLDVLRYNYRRQLSDLRFFWGFIYMANSRRVFTWTLIGCAMASSVCVNSLQAENPPSTKTIISAIRNGVKFLLSQEHKGSGWEQAGSSPWWVDDIGGKTAIATEALLDVEQTLHLRRLNIFKPPMQEAIKYLITHRYPTTYYASFTANALALLPPKRAYRAELRWTELYLLAAMTHTGGYGYAAGPQQKKYTKNPWAWDNSNSQYGILGLWACAHAGFAVPWRYWSHGAFHWRHKQRMDGTWGYGPFPGTGAAHSAPFGRAATFTPAGVASLLICDEFMGAREVSSRPKPDENVVRGLQWIRNNFNPNMRDQYKMYCYERVGLASGLTTFAGHNWYNDFARTITAPGAQQGGGFWWCNPDLNNPWWAGAYESQIVGTAYSLLLLDRGLNPIFMSKLQYTKHYYGAWNIRPRDLANATSYITTHTEAPLSWQVININSPVSQWLNSPILFISGKTDPKFTHAQIDKLRHYVNAGGMIFCSPVGYSRVFRLAMIKYAQEIVHHRYEVHQLSAKSALLTMQPWFHMHDRLLGISNGVRYLWVMSPGDIGAVWQRRAFSDRVAWELPINLYLYCTGKGYLGTRLSTLNVPAPSEPASYQLKMGLIRYTGNWNPEPGAWPRFVKLAATDFQTDVTLSTVRIHSLHVHEEQLIHLTGTGKFAFSSAQIASIRRYLNHGGMLFADAAGGHSSFVDSFDQFAQKLYPHTAMVSLNTASSIYTGNLPGGQKISHVLYRKYFIVRHGFKSGPQLLGIRKNHRWVVIFSPQDITSGLLGTNTWGIDGYAPKSAIALARNIVLYAAEKH